MQRILLSLGPTPLDITGCSRHTGFFHSIKYDYLRPLLLLFMRRSAGLAIITFQISAQTSHPQGCLAWLPSEEMKTRSYTFPLSPIISSFITDHTCTYLFIVFTVRWGKAQWLWPQTPEPSRIGHVSNT